MAVFIDRRQLLKTLGCGGLTAAAGGILAALPPVRADAAGRTPPAVSGSGRTVFVRVPLGGGIVPHAGSTSMELYHRHPHDSREEVVQPEDIRLQTRLLMRNHKDILDRAGLDWSHVAKLTRYQRRMDESPAIEAVLRTYFKNWWPAMTTYEVSGLSSPQARLEIDLWVVPNGTRVVRG
jgi:enamine deaminase RidA (YjgF/YER057c/UK114 family)